MPGATGQAAVLTGVLKPCGSFLSAIRSSQVSDPHWKDGLEGVGVVSVSTDYAALRTWVRVAASTWEAGQCTAVIPVLES